MYDKQACRVSGHSTDPVVGAESDNCIHENKPMKAKGFFES